MGSVIAAHASRCPHGRVDSQRLAGPFQPRSFNDDWVVHHSDQRLSALRVQQNPAETQTARHNYSPCDLGDDQGLPEVPLPTPEILVLCNFVHTNCLRIGKYVASRKLLDAWKVTTTPVAYRGRQFAFG